MGAPGAILRPPDPGSIANTSPDLGPQPANNFFGTSEPIDELVERLVAESHQAPGRADSVQAMYRTWHCDHMDHSRPRNTRQTSTNAGKNTGTGKGLLFQIVYRALSVDSPKPPRRPSFVLVPFADLRE